MIEISISKFLKFGKTRFEHFIIRYCELMCFELLPLIQKFFTSLFGEGIEILKFRPLFQLDSTSFLVSLVCVCRLRCVARIAELTIVTAARIINTRAK